MRKIVAIASLIFSVVFISCDQDFNTIGADLVGNEHFDLNEYKVQNLKAYSVRTGEVQTNNLDINPLGFYNNPYFGLTKANFVTQAALDVVQPNFGTDIKVENVTLYVPYFSTPISTNSEGATTYVLDSIYGANKTSKMKLSVYENGYFINNLDPSSNFEDEQKYFSNSTSSSGLVNFEGLKIGHNNTDGTPVQDGTRLNDDNDSNDDNVDDFKDNDQFFFNKEEVLVYKTKYNTTTGKLEYVNADDVVLADQYNVSARVVIERLPPGIFITLNRDFFKKRILDAPSDKLYSNNDFRQYFKGLYFKMEQNTGEEGAMAMLNFNSASLKINFNSINAGTTAPTPKTYLMKLGVNGGGNTVSLQDFNYGGSYDTGLNLSATNPNFGSDERLYLKGGKGSLVYMDVFGDDLLNSDLVAGPNGVPDELDELRKKGWLINDAYLEFYVDKAAMSGNSKSQEPERLYLYDATNQKTLVDYSFDASINSNPKRSKIIFGGIVERDDTADRKAVRYKIRITQYINNILNSPNFNLNKNLRLGLCVTENITLASNLFFKNPLDLNNTPTNTSDDVKLFPVSSINSQQGVVLHGTASTDEAKRLKLTIHYTKPN